MEKYVNYVEYITKRQVGLKTRFHIFNENVQNNTNLYSRDLWCHYACISAIEFSNDGELLVSGGADSRVMLWQVGKTILGHGNPVAMTTEHTQNINCLAITSDNEMIYSGGNDNDVIVHNIQTTESMDHLDHQREVFGLSIDPYNNNNVATAGKDGRLLMFDIRHGARESMIISRRSRPFFNVMFHPVTPGLVLSANVRSGIALWDLRTVKKPVIRYLSTSGTRDFHSLSARFNSTGTHFVSLHNEHSPALYFVRTPRPILQLEDMDYYNSCTVRSACFAGEHDRFIFSGSDDANVYMWDLGRCVELYVEHDFGMLPIMTSEFVLRGHRSLVYQVRYNPQYCILASAGVEKIIKLWSPFKFPEVVEGRPGAIHHMEAQDLRDPRQGYNLFGQRPITPERLNRYTTEEQRTFEEPSVLAYYNSRIYREITLDRFDVESLDDESSSSSDMDTSDSGQHDTNFNLSGGSHCRNCPNRRTCVAAQRNHRNNQIPGYRLTRRLPPNYRAKPRRDCKHYRPLPRAIAIPNTYWVRNNMGGMDSYVDHLIARNPTSAAGVNLSRGGRRQHCTRSSPRSSRSDESLTRVSVRRFIYIENGAQTNSRAGFNSGRESTLTLQSVAAGSNNAAGQSASGGHDNLASGENDYVDYAQPSTSSGYTGRAGPRPSVSGSQYARPGHYARGQDSDSDSEATESDLANRGRALTHQPHNNRAGSRRAGPDHYASRQDSNSDSEATVSDPGNRNRAMTRQPHNARAGSSRVGSDHYGGGENSDFDSEATESDPGNRGRVMTRQPNSAGASSSRAGPDYYDSRQDSDWDSEATESDPGTRGRAMTRQLHNAGAGSSRTGADHNDGGQDSDCYSEDSADAGTRLGCLGQDLTRSTSSREPEYNTSGQDSDSYSGESFEEITRSEYRDQALGRLFRNDGAGSNNAEGQSTSSREPENFVSIIPTQSDEITEPYLDNESKDNAESSNVSVHNEQSITEVFEISHPDSNDDAVYFTENGQPIAPCSTEDSGNNDQFTAEAEVIEIANPDSNNVVIIDESDQPITACNTEENDSNETPTETDARKPAEGINESETDTPDV